MEPKLRSIFALLLTLAAALYCQSATPEKLSDDFGAVKGRQKVKYVGAVLEYEPYIDWKDGGEEIVRENSRIIAEYAADAKSQGADIIIAPEYGLTGLEMHILRPKELFSLMQYVPDPGLSVVPCTTPVDPPNVVAVQDLSCSAKENAMYIVVDVAEASPCSPDVRNPFNNTLDTSRDCPKSGYIYYNTQVVFDRSGAVIARYRKQNLFMEPQFQSGLDPVESAIFTTDFNVTFTLQICFDICFANPGLKNIAKYDIYDVAMSTAWVDVLPFFLAPSVQNAWSRSLGVNLLVSGYHNPEKSKLGSGIYQGPPDAREITYISDPDSGSRLLVSEVETYESEARRFDRDTDLRLLFPEVETYESEARPFDPDTDSRLLFPEVDMYASEDERFFRVSRKEHGRNNRSHKPFAAEEYSREQSRNLTVYFDDISMYANVPLVHEGDAPQQAKACHDDGFCCSLSYYPTGKLNYSLVAYSGMVLEMLPYHIYSQVCAVLWCQTDDVNTCTHVEEGLPESDTFGAFKLSAPFDTGCVYPSLVHRNFSLAENSLYSFPDNPQLTSSTEGGILFTLSTGGPVTDLLVTAMFGRWYSRDDGGNHTSAC
ncbi:pantetheinase-like [Macrobrachium nipponense]|uniref:pantetheinase-like n=1 Tax=Macrobrachium nipponense TaxID=159736 RepID=UPI0030C89FB5